MKTQGESAHSMIPPLWTPPPTRLAAESGYAHVFRFGLDLSAPRLADLQALLSTDEHARAERMRSPEAQQGFIAAHGQLRQVLGSYLQRDPASLRFVTHPDGHPHGKPALAEDERGSALREHRPALRFNLSHCAGLALLAVTFGQEAGVDVEALDRPVDFAAIAQRFFTPAESADLLALSKSEQPIAFFNLWTRKEAYLKARGLGLSLPLDSFGVSFKPGVPAHFDPPLPGWSLYALDPGPGFTGALAVEGEISGIRCWDWPPAL